MLTLLESSLLRNACKKWFPKRVSIFPATFAVSNGSRPTRWLSSNFRSEYYPFVPWKVRGELDAVEFPPERRRLHPLQRSPYINTATKPVKHARHLIDYRGPELVRNQLSYGQYGVQALDGGELLFGHLEMLRLTINRHLDEKRMFAVWGVESPWKAKTKRSQGKRMGGGKPDIHHYVTPIRSGRIIVELGGYLDWQEAYRVLSRVADKLPFPARFVSQELLDCEKRIEGYIAAKNVNPFADARQALYHNYAGCHQFISPYHLEWDTTKFI
ncbi:ribosomal protein L16 [Opisthorchis viverrini]|uniref:Large ribosomal subunit protein uL16m n=2 Tax=Opisthorchis viverrini TaxID=6198 RepID=A0A074YX33_OPIVI|nr:hypothetical protein T265_11841 [Opisthorchis viverrini]KER19366.1 hypothetical protein T265_11841 [Opisthorchis viverrini]OON20855.1 ribosomal protein L16 [Opisthorchis viverrini]